MILAIFFSLFLRNSLHRFEKIVTIVPYFKAYYWSLLFTNCATNVHLNHLNSAAWCIKYLTVRAADAHSYN
jgi:hypothetical protein